jgi:TRAP-type mannitol/chloroaromatic compound transport system substrate-binding protein
LPVKVRHLESKFNKQLDSAYKKLGLDKEQSEFLKFKNLVDSYAEENNSRKLDHEQLFVRKKVDEITREIKQLENNISFISNASEDNPLVQNVYKNIDNYKKDLEVWKKKLDYLSNLDY